MQIKQSTTAKALVFYMVDSTDHVTPKTGLSPTVTLSKNGAAFASPSGTVSEISGGFYKVAGNATDTNTLGMLALKATGTAADPVAMAYEVVAFDPDDAAGLGLSRVDAAVTSRSTLTAANVWDEALSGHTTAGTAGKKLADLIALAATDVWAATTRTLSAFGFSVTASTVSDKTGYSLTVTPPTAAAIASAVCDEALTGHTTAGTLGKKISDTSTLTDAQVWSYATRILTDFGFLVTVGTNNDKTGYTLTATPPTAAAIATQVRTELTTELGRIDVATSTRNATTPPTVGAIADQVWDEVLSGHLTAGTTGAAIQAAGGAGDPWSTVVPGSYAAGTAGALFGKLDVGEASDPVIVLPSAPVDNTMCRVYGYLETINNQVAAGIEITFDLVTASPAASNKLLSGRRITITTDAQGRISDGTNAYLDLQRNDLIDPAGSTYRVTCKELGMDRVEITLSATTFDLKSIV